jgi:hypothetical protein
MDAATNDQGRRWWRYGYVWLVIAGPVLVVIAGLVTTWIALRDPDPVLSVDYYRRGIEINKELADKALMPALQGRNHAATPPPGQAR